MTVSTKQTGITLTSNRLACEPPAVFVRDGSRSWMPYDERWHRTMRLEFPKVEFVPHPTEKEFGFDVCVTHDPVTDELEGNVCGFRLRPGTPAPEVKKSIPFNREIEQEVERRALLNV